MDRRRAVALNRPVVSMRRPESALLPELFPAPNSEGGLARQREPQLMSEHAHLAAVVGLVRDHVGEHGCARRPRFSPAVAMKLFNAALRVESLLQHLRTECGTLREGLLDLLRRAVGTGELGWPLQVRRGQAKPLAADVVDMAEDGGDGARFAVRKLGSPRAGIEMLEHQLVHAVVDRERLRHTLAQIRSGRGS